MKAIILLSGGLDSTVILAMAIAQGKECIALSFDYGQRHRVELDAASAIAEYYRIPHHLIKIDPQAFVGSALTSHEPIAKNRNVQEMASQGIPNTYVPARNTLFLAYAMGLAERCQVDEIHFGANRDDRLCYPDCQPAFMEAFQGVLNVATKQACEGHPVRLVTPLADLAKSEIIRLGMALKAPLDQTISCYDPDRDGRPCFQCDACVLRNQSYTG